MAKKKKVPSNIIAQNKKARFDYHITDTIEAGVSLLGWEVKSCREGKVQLVDSYVLFKGGEAFLLGVQIQPLQTVSTHYVTDPTRTRKLLLNRKEISRLQAATEQKGYTVVATSLYWKGHLVKCGVSLGKGKQDHDKRATEKERDWNREKTRTLKANN
ncbi:MAG: SsrA-binding protein SmpB [Cellvibrionaceae bacterium]